MKLSKIISVLAAVLISYTFVQYVLVRKDAIKFANDFKTYDSDTSAIKIYDRNYKLMYTFNKKNQIPVQLIDVNATLVTLILAIEDANFFNHDGVSYKGLARSAKDFILFRGVSGGSTITMQLVRTLTNNREKTLGRKFKEIIYAWELEKKYSKEEILERYLNEVYVGRNLYGVEAASKFYFGKTSSSLSTNESMFISGMLNAPEKYTSSTLQSKRMYLRRKAHVLKRAKQFNGDFYHSLITSGSYDYSPELQENYIKSQSPNSHAMEEVRKYLYSKYTSDELKRGLRVYTTFDSEMQDWGEQAINGLTAYGIETEGALLVINQLTGEIYAVVGGLDFTQSQLNRAFQAKRQPGSAFKPFVYGAAFEAGKNPLTILQDTPIKIKMDRINYYAPSNNDNDFWGPVTAWESLVYSRNVPAVKLNMQIGPSKTVEYAQKCGIESEISKYPGSALGTSTVTLKELTRSYGTIANLGIKTPTLFFITRIENKYDRLLEEHKKETTTQVLNPEKTYLLVETLRGVIEKGTGKKIKIDWPLAGKTGTSNNNSDTWFVGFSSTITCGVWVGRDDNKQISPHAEGGTIAASVWSYFMNNALTKTKKEELPLPVGMQRQDFGPPNKQIEYEIYLNRLRAKVKLRKAPPEEIAWGVK